MAKGPPKRLSIWMYGHHIATLSQTKDSLGLVYTLAAQAAYDVNIPLLSQSLPVGPSAFKHAVVHPFFNGLLPEGQARQIIAHDLKLAENDTFGLLQALGRDCAGALVILPEGEALPVQSAAMPAPLPAGDVETLIRQLPNEPLGITHQIRISLAGVQHKLVLSALPTGDWALPINGLPSTHILKQADPRFNHMVANEAFCLALGRHLGISVAEAKVAAMPLPILVVTRYDRQIAADGTIRRIHQEDLTQALSVSASAKYEEHGGPTLREVASLIRTATGGSGDVERLLDVTVLNMIVGNADAHAKNFSLLHLDTGLVQLAPAYDIMSTVYYPRVDGRPAMSVNGKVSITTITTTDIVREAATWGLRTTRAIHRVAGLLQRLPAAIDAAVIDVPDAPEDLVALVRTRAAAYLNDPPD
jgi:serine/threonine-protein kinase HipA